MKQNRSWLPIGPGVLVAASGIGGSDVVAATVAGARFGSDLLWALALGALLKFVLAEGIARWQLANGTTLVQGWARHLPRWVLLLFTLYLFLWCIGVGGALVASCGMAVENLSGGRIPASWGAMSHAVAVYLLLLSSHSRAFHSLMKGFIGMMVAGVAAAAIFSPASAGELLHGFFVPSIPPGAELYVLSLIGGVGGSVTMLGYNYLVLENQSAQPRGLNAMRTDLALAYLFTTLFAGSLMVLAGSAFGIAAVSLSGMEAVSRMAEQLERMFGLSGFVVYSVGFWAAVLASLVGVWRLVPSILADCALALRCSKEDRLNIEIQPRSKSFRLSLTFLLLVSLPFAFHEKPVLVVVDFTVLGSLFIPFLAGTLLFLNNSLSWDSTIPKNSRWTNFMIILTLALFLVLGGSQIWHFFR